MIKRDILEGTIAVETVLNERALSARYGLSRTPLRTAFSRLEREGVVSRLDGGTLLVRSISVEQFLQIVDLRRMLESAASARAAERGVTDELQREREYLRAYADALRSRFDDFWEHDERFHLAIARAAGLQLLPGIIAEQRAIARRCTIAKRLDHFFEQAAEHLTVLEAIERGDSEAARTAMDAHLGNARSRFVQSLTVSQGGIEPAPLGRERIFDER